MTLSATYILIDLSPTMINGDYPPLTRYTSMLSTIDLLFHYFINSNPENEVGLLSSSSILSSLTKDYGQILSALHGVKLNAGDETDLKKVTIAEKGENDSGDSTQSTVLGDFVSGATGDLSEFKGLSGVSLNKSISTPSTKVGSFSQGVLTATLALKHRLNKNQHQRVVAFIGSPLTESDSDLSLLAKRLKKNGLDIDIINFGEVTLNTDKLEKFISLCTSESHLVTVPPSQTLLYEAVASSPIVSGGDFSLDGFNDFGQDIDPDLALALRLSLEEEKSRLEREKAESEKKNGDVEMKE